MLRIVSAEPSLLIVADKSFWLHIRQDGSATLKPAGGELHLLPCELEKLARLLQEARRMAARHFGSEWCG